MILGGFFKSSSDIGKVELSKVRIGHQGVGGRWKGRENSIKDVREEMESAMNRLVSQDRYLEDICNRRHGCREGRRVCASLECSERFSDSDSDFFGPTRAKCERLNRINSFRAKDESGTEDISSQVVVSVLSLIDMAKASRAYMVVDSCCQS